MLMYLFIMLVGFGIAYPLIGIPVGYIIAWYKGEKLTLQEVWREL